MILGKGSLRRQGRHLTKPLPSVTGIEGPLSLTKAPCYLKAHELGLGGVQRGSTMCPQSNREHSGMYFRELTELEL